MEIIVLYAALATMVAAPFLIGAVARRYSRAGRRERAARATPITRVADARQGEAVRVRGRVRPLLHAMRLPISGSQGVYHWTQVVNTANPGATDVFEASRWCPFEIEDDSGTARLQPSAGLLPITTEKESGAVDRDNPDLVSLVGATLRHWMGHTPVQWRQHRIEVGDTVTIHGRAEFEAALGEKGAELGGDYRQPPRRLLIAAIDGVVLVDAIGSRPTVLKRPESRAF